ncbi:hypothetical protein ZWY2020_058626 [Hordeum vulgare]|nr:hypothetical protein ZWY2020_058626 [Hordeum vulgare]
MKARRGHGRGENRSGDSVDAANGGCSVDEREATHRGERGGGSGNQREWQQRANAGPSEASCGCGGSGVTQWGGRNARRRRVQQRQGRAGQGGSKPGCGGAFGALLEEAGAALGEGNPFAVLVGPETHLDLDGVPLHVCCA